MTLASRLLTWYATNKRDLPWRKTRDPYQILVSEVMLQQTQVSRGLIFYPRWLKRFPDWKTLAQADNAAVIEAWAGLGYNRRALMLRDIARAIQKEGVPTHGTAWLKLKGIGPYTAAALACFSLGERVLPIDTNIRRVLGRVLLGTAFPQPEDDENIQIQSKNLLPKARFQDVPQALFDLATMVCIKNPSCDLCPFKSVCPCAAGFKQGAYAIPKQMIKKANESRHRDKPHPDRIYRGRILQAIQKMPNLTARTIGSKIDPEFDATADSNWLERMLERLKKDGLIHEKRGILKLG